jgi:hypothetical protein
MSGKVGTQFTNSGVIGSPVLGEPASGVITNLTGTLTSPTFVTPALGTPASGDLENVTFNSGQIVQCAGANLRTQVTTSSVMQHDNTIPQIGEGAELGTLSYTPLHASNILIIHVSVAGSANNARSQFICALFQDSTGSALAMGSTRGNDQGGGETANSFFHRMVAGTTSSTSFKVRAGGGGVASVINGSQSFGGVIGSGITIWELEQ